MIKLRKAFTLIELLVVIAIIAILAAILFPVFAQAKAAAKYAVGLSNVKQIEFANIMYANDNDDTRVPEIVQDIEYDSNHVFVAVLNEWSWKQVTAPYAKNTQLYSDTFNPAGQYLDDHSDPATRAFEGWTTTNLPSNLVFDLSYAIANLGTGSTNPAPFYNYDAVPMGAISSVATTFDVIETKDFFTNTGTYEGWNENVDAETLNNPWPAGVNPTTGMVWNWTGGKWNSQAMGVAFLDGHSKRQSNGATCAASWYNQPISNDQPDNWNIPASEFKSDASWQSDWGWANSFCSTMPAAFN